MRVINSLRLGPLSRLSSSPPLRRVCVMEVDEAPLVARENLKKRAQPESTELEAQDPNSDTPTEVGSPPADLFESAEGDSDTAHFDLSSDEETDSDLDVTSNKAHRDEIEMFLEQWPDMGKNYKLLKKIGEGRIRQYGICSFYVFLTSPFARDFQARSAPSTRPLT